MPPTHSRGLLAPPSHLPGAGRTPLRPDDKGARRRHPQPHDGFLLRSRFLLRAGPFLRARGTVGRTRRRRGRRRRGQSRPGSGGDRGGGARPGRSCDRVTSRTLRRAAFGRHLAGVGRRRRFRGRSCPRQRHQRVRGPCVPPSRRRGRSGCRCHPHTPLATCARPRAALRRRRGRSRALPAGPRRERPVVRDPGRPHNPRRRPRPRQDGRTVTSAAAELRTPRLARLPVAPVLVEQDLPGGPVGPRDRRTPQCVVGFSRDGDRRRVPPGQGPRRRRDLQGARPPGRDRRIGRRSRSRPGEAPEDAVPGTILGAGMPQ